MSLRSPTENENTITLDVTYVMLSVSEASAFRTEKKQILRLRLRMTLWGVQPGHVLIQ
jgi:hypothetical protein